jgi:putative effector of murein hydrolase
MNVHVFRFRKTGKAMPGSDEAKSSSPAIPASLRIAAMSLRTAFIVLLGIVTLRVTIPGRETLFSIYVEWGDLVRFGLGLAVCVWLAMQIFKRPKTIKGYWVWLYLGLVAVPFALICLVAIW